ncbi:MAG: 30S ribosomal protein S6 [Desulfotalea sp.]
MRRYETIFILHPTSGEEQITSTIEMVSSIITESAGTIIKLDKWGMKKLAYFIKKESQGYYVYCDYAGTPAAVAEIERRFRIEELVMKFMTVKLNDEISTEEAQQAIGDIAAEEAAAKEAAEEAEKEAEGETVETKPSETAETKTAEAKTE